MPVPRPTRRVVLVKLLLIPQLHRHRHHPAKNKAGCDHSAASLGRGAHLGKPQKLWPEGETTTLNIGGPYHSDGRSSLIPLGGSSSSRTIYVWDLGVVNCGTKKLKAVLGKTFIFLTKLAQITRESSILLVPLVNKARITVNHFKSPAPGVNTMMWGTGRNGSWWFHQICESLLFIIKFP